MHIVYTLVVKRYSLQQLPFALALVRVRAMVHLGSTFQPHAGGPNLHACTYPCSTPKAYFFFHHGIGEHCGRYEAGALVQGKERLMLCTPVVKEGETQHLYITLRLHEITARVHAAFERLSDQGIVTHTYDMRGAGKSEENPQERSKISSFEEVVNDLVEFCRQKRDGAFAASAGRVRTHSRAPADAAA
jgi:hypothetical protein